MTTVTTKPAFPATALARLTGYSEAAFTETLKKLAALDYADFDSGTRITADNVSILAATSALVYETSADQTNFLAAQPAIKSFALLDSENNESLGIPFDDTGTQVGVYETDGALIVAARGTVFATDSPGFLDREWEDVWNNLSAYPSTDENSQAWVHAGFKRATDGIWEQLKPHLERARTQGKAVHFTGHSLGAAVATHLAHRALQRLRIQPTSLTTFGGPAIGWGDHKEFLDGSLGDRTLRLASSGDPTIWAVPGGRHTGTEGYFDRNRELHEGEDWNVLDRTLTLADDIRGLRHPIEHHHPLNYCKLVEENRAVLDQW